MDANETKYEVRGVLAGAYKGARKNLEVCLTHLVLTSESKGDLAVHCGGVEIDNLCDMVEEGAPTCKKCLAKFLTLPKGLARHDPQTKPQLSSCLAFRR